jgi:hypothetical protein
LGIALSFAWARPSTGPSPITPPAPLTCRPLHGRGAPRRSPVATTAWWLAGGGDKVALSFPSLPQILWLTLCPLQCSSFSASRRSTSPERGCRRSPCSAAANGLPASPLHVREAHLPRLLPLRASFEPGGTVAVDRADPLRHGRRRSPLSAAAPAPPLLLRPVRRVRCELLASPDIVLFLLVRRRLVVAGSVPSPPSVIVAAVAADRLRSRRMPR